MRRAYLVSILWMILITGTGFALASLGLPYIWHLGTALLLYVLLGARAQPDGWALTNRGGPRVVRQVVLAIALVLGGFCVLALVSVTVINWMQIRFEVIPQNVTRPDLFWSYVVLGVLWAPLVEETIWRGMLYPHMELLLGRRAAILGNALLFWMLHWIYYDGVTLPNHFFGGLVFAWLYDRTRSLIIPIVVHAVSNLCMGLADLLWLEQQESVRMWLGWH